jgi:hypothetical protein
MGIHVTVTSLAHVVLLHLIALVTFVKVVNCEAPRTLILTVLLSKNQDSLPHPAIGL